MATGKRILIKSLGSKTDHRGSLLPTRTGVQNLCQRLILIGMKEAVTEIIPASADVAC
jgi:hypothetical protein